MAIVRVQAPNIAANSTAGQTTITNTFGSNVTAGSLLVACGVGGADGSTQTYSSTGGPTWNKIAQFSDTGGSGEAISIGYSMAAPAGATTVTLTFASATQFKALAIGEYSGAASSAALDKNTTGLTTGLTATPTDSSMTTIADGELIVCCLLFRNATRPASVGAGYTAIGTIDNSIVNFGAEDRIQATQGAIAPTWTLTAGTAASAIMSATFKAAAAAAGTPFVGMPRTR
jgi:hypothetical protein